MKIYVDNIICTKRNIHALDSASTHPEGVSKKRRTRVPILNHLSVKLSHVFQAFDSTLR